MYSIFLTGEIMGGILGIILIVVGAILIEEEKIHFRLGRKPEHIRAKEASIAAEYRAREAYYREIEQKIMMLPSTDAGLSDLLKLKQLTEGDNRQSRPMRGDVV